MAAAAPQSQRSKPALRAAACKPASALTAVARWPLLGCCGCRRRCRAADFWLPLNCLGLMRPAERRACHNRLCKRRRLLVPAAAKPDAGCRQLSSNLGLAPGVRRRPCRWLLLLLLRLLPSLRSSCRRRCRRLPRHSTLRLRKLIAGHCPPPAGTAEGRVLVNGAKWQHVLLVSKVVKQRPLLRKQLQAWGGVRTCKQTAVSLVCERGQRCLLNRRLRSAQGGQLPKERLGLAQTPLKMPLPRQAHVYVPGQVFHGQTTKGLPRVLTPSGSLIWSRLAFIRRHREASWSSSAASQSTPNRAARARSLCGGRGQAALRGGGGEWQAQVRRQAGRRAATRASRPPRSIQECSHVATPVSLVVDAWRLWLRRWWARRQRCRGPMLLLRQLQRRRRRRRLSFPRLFRAAKVSRPRGLPRPAALLRPRLCAVSGRWRGRGASRHLQPRPLGLWRRLLGRRAAVAPPPRC